MKLIKGLLAIAMISLIAVSCNETKKDVEKDNQEKVEIAKQEVNAAAKTVEADAEKAIDSTKTEAEEAIDSTKAMAEGMSKKCEGKCSKDGKSCDGSCKA